MTENQWLISTNPVEMYTFVKDRVTERQQRFFVEACRANAPKPWNFRVDSIRWGELAEEWCSRMVFNKDISASVVCDLLREIIGNPFRPIVCREGEFWRRNVAIPQWLWEEKPPNSIEFDPAWLTWNNATIPNLIRAMMEEECQECYGSGCQVRVTGRGEHGDCEQESCDFCNGKGYVPRDEPQWDMMPILGDALEEAGCTEAAILDHLRGTEPCPHCDGEGARFYDEDDRLQCKQRCDDCNGTGNCPVRHVVGCWCVELLKGAIQ